jgi:hypothetical protein
LAAASPAGVPGVASSTEIGVSSGALRPHPVNMIEKASIAKTAAVFFME